MVRSENSKMNLFSFQSQDRGEWTYCGGTLIFLSILLHLQTTNPLTWLSFFHHVVLYLQLTCDLSVSELAILSLSSFFTFLVLPFVNEVGSFSLLNLWLLCVVHFLALLPWLPDECVCCEFLANWMLGICSTNSVLLAVLRVSEVLFAAIIRMIYGVIHSIVAHSATIINVKP